jgi:hypothetical protein
MVSPAWLRCADRPVDNAANPAKFPYSRYVLIKTEADCFGAIQDETQQWDWAFRSTLSASLCKLIMLFNQSHRFQTTHTVIGSHNPQTIPGYEWATASIGVALTIVFRETSARFEINDHVDLVRWLCPLLSTSAFTGNSTRWLLGIRPEVLLYEGVDGSDIRYGVELRAASFGNGDSRCAERLSRLLDWITELVSSAATQARQNF